MRTKSKYFAFSTVDGTPQNHACRDPLHKYLHGRKRGRDHHLRLIRESKIDAEWWVDVSDEFLIGCQFGGEFGNGVHVGVVKLDEVLVCVDAGWGYGLGENGASTGHCTKY